MEIRVVSDIHLDRDIIRIRKAIKDDASKKIIDSIWFPEQMLGDENRTLVIAGDISCDDMFISVDLGNGKSWLEEVSTRFKYIVFVLGNHDYWGGHLSVTGRKIDLFIKEKNLSNCFFLEDRAVVLDNVKFVGSVLWTNYNKNHPTTKMHCRAYMDKDHTYIKFGRKHRKVTTDDLYERHQNSKRFIFENCKKDNPDQTVVVVTHMAPSYESITKEYRNTEDYLSNFAYFSDLDNRILQQGQDIKYWIHGHTHSALSYKIGNVEVVINARGYSDAWGQAQVNQFSDKKILET